ncbi:Large ribosomal subunit protein uL4 [Entamoeba marina]
MSSRPFVTIYDGITGEAEKTPVRLPSVFLAPVRGDVVHFVFRNQNKNKRQPEAVTVARIPRISGSGSGRNGQGAFGNMTRKGHMFSPLKVFRKWQRKTPKQMRRYAVASCIAASAVPSLVSARGHHIGGVAQIPLKTKQAVYLLKKIHAYTDVLKVIASKTSRAGQGKMRGRTTKSRKGPLIVYGDDNIQSIRAFRNIPGVDSCRVEKLSVLNLAPGGHMGRFIIWTESAFKKLNTLFGTQKKISSCKKNFRIARAQMAVPDIKRVITAAEKSKILRAKITQSKSPKRLNPLTNWAAMVKLNPYAAIAKNRIQQIQKANAAKKVVAAERVEKILAARKEAMNIALEKKSVKAKRVDGKLQKVKVENNLIKPVVKRTEKQKTYMKKIAAFKKAQEKRFVEQISI